MGRFACLVAGEKKRLKNDLRGGWSDNDTEKVLHLGRVGGWPGFFDGERLC
jgi:hypothetical protein